MGTLPEQVRGQEVAANAELSGDCGVGQPPSLPREVSRLETVDDVCSEDYGGHDDDLLLMPDEPEEDQPAEQSSTSTRKGRGRPHPLSRGNQQVDDSGQCQE